MIVKLAAEHLTKLCEVYDRSEERVRLIIVVCYYPHGSNRAVKLELNPGGPGPSY